MKPFVLDEPVNGTYWPELEPNSKAIGDYGTGYYNVLTVNTDISMTGYRFDYMWFEDDGQRKYLSSISLPRLRKRVLTAGLEWKVLDAKAASKTLTLNLLDLHFRNIKRAERLFNEKFSGVAYVRRGSKSNSMDSLWIYFKYDRDDQSRFHFTAKTLRVLKKKAERNGAPWVILHEDVYNYIIQQEEIYL